jgi:glutaredoxin
MIHHSCDLCKRLIDTDQDVRYVVKMEVYAALDPALDETDDERDGLQEVQDMLQRMEETGTEGVEEDEVYQQLRFDLCPECRKKFLKQPLGRQAVKQFDFSQN